MNFIDRRLRALKIRYNWVQNNKIVLLDCGLELDPIASLKNYINLIANCNAVFSRNKNEALISLNSLKFNIQTPEELFILNEIFVKEIYNILPLEDSIVIDVGMNVGIASLFFAMNSKVRHIYGFEPVTETFNQAKYNISLNYELSAKISTYNFGLGNEKRFVDVEYDPQNRGQVNIYGKRKNLKSFDVDLKKTTVQIEEVAVLFDILQLNENRYKIIKIDSEGSEYEILEGMNRIGMLKVINFLIIEWHFKGPEKLIEILKENGHHVLSLREEDNITGLLYSFKR